MIALSGSLSSEDLVEVPRGSLVWSGIGVKIKVAFHCADLAFYAVLFEFNVASVAFSCRVTN